MAIIPSFFMNAVVALGVDAPDNNKHWIGTGFIVGRRDPQNVDLLTYYLVTNKHVIAEPKRIYVRFNSLGSSLVKDYSIDLYDSNGSPAFSAHPNASTDIIAIQISPQTLINDKSIWGSFDLDSRALTLSQMKQTGVEEGSLVYALGFPMGKVEVIKAPICRLGCISRVMDAFIRQKECPTFLVDAQVYPGNSGGPIVSRPEQMSIEGTPANNKANLIGILSDYIPYQETLYSRQTGRARMIQEENSGLTVVHPVDRIKEVVELEWQRIENQNIQRVKNKPTAEVKTTRSTAEATV